MMHADQICIYSTLGDPKTAKIKDMGLLDRASIPLYFHDESGTVTNNHLSSKATSLKQLVFNVCKEEFFSIVTGLTNIIDCCFLSTLNLCGIFCIFIPFWPLLDLKMQLN